MLVAVSCTTLPENFSKHQEGSWKAKSLIQDLKKRQSYVVYIDINAISPDKVRMDVETSLGIHVASFSLNQERVQILVPDRKRYYSGKSSPKALKKVIPLELDPRWLVDVLFEKNMSEPNWKCTNDNNNQLKACERKGLKITWTKRQRQMRVVAFESKTAKVQMQLKGFEASAKQGEFYSIKKPKGFRHIKL